MVKSPPPLTIQAITMVLGWCLHRFDDEKSAANQHPINQSTTVYPKDWLPIPGEGAETGNYSV